MRAAASKLRPRWACLAIWVYPGLNATAISNYKVLDEPYIHHFPDGNASIARMLVRQMIPRVASGKTMEDVVSADFDYAAFRKLYGESAVPLLVITAEGKLRLFTVKEPPDPQPGQTLVSLVRPVKGESGEKGRGAGKD